MKSNKQAKSVAVIGLGYVGLPLAVEFSKKRKVYGFDLNKKRIDELKCCIDNTKELSSDELANLSSIEFTSNIENVKQAQIFIITVPTPVDMNKRPDFGPLRKACQFIARVLKPGDIAIFESTVFPGATEEICVPILVELSGLKYLKGEDNINEGLSGFYVGYSPERINPGDKNRKLSNIVKITSGSTPKSAKEIDELYSEIITAGTFPVKYIKVAEAAKVIENSQRDLNIAFVNELSIIFSKLGIDTGEVLEAAETKWNFLPFKPGLVGGHCIGVDPYYLTYKAEEIGYISQVILSGRRINDGMAEYVATQIVRLMNLNGIQIKGSKVGMLGATFKENCPDVRNSKVLELAARLKEWGIEIMVIDAHASYEAVMSESGLELSQLEDLYDLDSLVIAVAHEEYKKLSLEFLRGLCKKNVRPIMADIKGIWNREQVELAGFTPFRL